MQAWRSAWIRRAIAYVWNTPSAKNAANRESLVALNARIMWYGTNAKNATEMSDATGPESLLSRALM